MTNLTTFNEFKLNENQMKNLTGGKKEMICTLGNGSTTNLYVDSQKDIGKTVDGWNAGYSGQSQYQIVGCENPFAVS